jgi:glycosyltransferase involved in cell wall biosynthesis
MVLAGNRDQAWIAALLAEASLALSPHMGRALVETALAGVPIVAYDHDWQAEFLEHGRTGLLVPAGDVEALAREGVRVLRDPLLARKMGDAARAMALATQDPALLARREREAYERVLSQRGDAP